MEGQEARTHAGDSGFPSEVRVVALRLRYRRFGQCGVAARIGPSGYESADHVKEVFQGIRPKQDRIRGWWAIGFRIADRTSGTVVPNCPQRRFRIVCGLATIQPDVVGREAPRTVLVWRRAALHDGGCHGQQVWAIRAVQSWTWHDPARRIDNERCVVRLDSARSLSAREVEASENLKG